MHIVREILQGPVLGTGKTDYMRLKALAETPAASAASRLLWIPE